MNPGGGSGWDEGPLDIQVPDDARELERDVVAYHRELRAQRRRIRMHRLTRPFSGPGTIMPLLASILAVCLVAGAMLSVATFSPAPADHPTTRPTTSAPAATHSTPPVASPANSAGTVPANTVPANTVPAIAPASTAPASTGAASTGLAGSGSASPSASRSGRSASPSAPASGTAGQPRPSGAASR